MNNYNGGLKSMKLTRREVVKTQVNAGRMSKLKYAQLRAGDSYSTIEAASRANSAAALP